MQSKFGCFAQLPWQKFNTFEFISGCFDCIFYIDLNQIRFDSILFYCRFERIKVEEIQMLKGFFICKIVSEEGTEPKHYIQHTERI